MIAAAVCWTVPYVHGLILPGAARSGRRNPASSALGRRATFVAGVCAEAPMNDDAGGDQAPDLADLLARRRLARVADNEARAVSPVGDRQAGRLHA